MSRLIPTRQDDNREKELRNTSDGKLILTKYHNKSLALLIADNRLLQVAVFEENASKVGDIYLGKIKNVVRNIEACFVEIEAGELVYLPFSQYDNVFLVNRTPDGRILEGDEILVQITKDPQKTKQASATAQITVTGDYFVFNTGSEHIGASTKLSTDTRNHLTHLAKEHLQKDKSLPPYGMVIRTQAAALSEDQFLSELQAQQEAFLTVFRKARHSTCFHCILKPDHAWENALRDISPNEYREVVTDLPKFRERTAPYFTSRQKPVRLYQDPAYSLTKLYGIESKLENALSRRIWLKSGAYLVFDITEALTVFDVNSGKYESKKASKETFYHINLEAAKEIALQLRLRNLSGIILIDFINMNDPALEQELIHSMQTLVKQDTVPTKVIDITPLGLMELTRKKISKPLYELL